jgi:N-acetylmuramic acid 6-phosphate etherase
MARLGNVYQNLMVDMRSSNQKVVRRVERTIAHICNCSESRPRGVLNTAAGKVKLAVVMGILSIDLEEAGNRLHYADGFIRNVFDATKKGDAHAPNSEHPHRQKWGTLISKGRSRCMACNDLVLPAVE